MTVYIFDVPATTLNAAVGLQRLAMEIQGILLREAVVDVREEELQLTFDSELTVDEETMLSAVLSSHTGEQIPYVKFLASAKMVHEEIIINQNTELQVIGGIVSRPAFFVKDLSKSFARISGQMKFVGEGLEGRIVQVEDGTGIETVLTAPMDTSNDRGGAWHTFEMFTSSITIDTQATYRFEGRLNGATSASFRFCTLELLERR